MEQKSVKPEITGKRNLNYNNWHRTLPAECLAWNLDFVEVRNSKIVAFLEVAETSYPLQAVNLKFKKGHKWLLTTLTKMTGIPSYIVYHNSDLTYFHVFDLQKDISFIYSEQEYRNWLINLGIRS